MTLYHLEPPQNSHSSRANNALPSSQFAVSQGHNNQGVLWCVFQALGAPLKGPAVKLLQRFRQAAFNVADG